MGYDEQHPPAHTPGAISERGPATPWNHEDYEFPPSVGPVIYYLCLKLFLLYIYINNINCFYLYIYIFITSLGKSEKFIKN